MELSQHLMYVQYLLLNNNKVLSCYAEPGAGDGLGRSCRFSKGNI